MLKLNLKQRWLNLTIEQRDLLAIIVLSWIGLFAFNNLLQGFNLPETDPGLLLSASELASYTIISILFLGCFVSAVFHLGRLWQTRRQ